MSIPNYIIGYSGHAYVVIEAAQSTGVVFTGYFDREEKDVNPYDLMYMGEESAELLKEAGWFVGIGHNQIRKRVYTSMQEVGQCLTIIHAMVSVSPTAKLGKGTLVGVRSVVNAGAEIGKGVILNSACIVEHECRIGDFSHIAPGAVLAGNVQVGEMSFIGANSVVKEGIVIGDNVVIGAGTVVLKDVPDGMTVAGNPGREIY